MSKLIFGLQSDDGLLVLGPVPLGFFELCFDLLLPSLRLTRVCQQPVSRLLSFDTLGLRLLKPCFNLELFSGELTDLRLYFDKTLLCCGQLHGNLLQSVLEPLPLNVLLAGIGLQLGEGEFRFRPFDFGLLEPFFETPFVQRELPCLGLQSRQTLFRLRQLFVRAPK